MKYATIERINDEFTGKPTPDLYRIAVWRNIGEVVYSNRIYRNDPNTVYAHQGREVLEMFEGSKADLRWFLKHKRPDVQVTMSPDAITFLMHTLTGKERF